MEESSADEIIEVVIVEGKNKFIIAISINATILDLKKKIHLYKHLDYSYQVSYQKLIINGKEMKQDNLNITSLSSRKATSTSGNKQLKFLLMLNTSYHNEKKMEEKKNEAKLIAQEVHAMKFDNVQEKQKDKTTLSPHASSVLLPACCPKDWCIAMDCKKIDKGFYMAVKLASLEEVETQNCFTTLQLVHGKEKCFIPIHESILPLITISTIKSILCENKFANLKSSRHLRLISKGKEVADDKSLEVCSSQKKLIKVMILSTAEHHDLKDMVSALRECEDTLQNLCRELEKMHQKFNHNFFTDLVELAIKIEQYEDISAQVQHNIQILSFNSTINPDEVRRLSEVERRVKEIKDRIQQLRNCIIRKQAN